jgi:hypothetical protein
LGRVIARRKSADEITVPYPAGVPPLDDDDTTLVADPAELEMSAQAMMFVDTGVIVGSKADFENGWDPFPSRSTPES